MTPALPDILKGCAAALGAPVPPEASGDYLAGRMAILMMLAGLAAQEAERGVAATLAENAAIRSFFAKAAPAHDADLGGRLAMAATRGDPDFSLAALAAANAELRRLLIALHERIEIVGDAALDREALRLYQFMAARRRLEFSAASQAE